MIIGAVALLAGCYHPTRGGVVPAPPGPVDILHVLLRNDYSRLCPKHYDYCRAGKDSICCPTGGCCDDGVAPYCCGTRDDPPGGRGPCGARSTTCSRAGITICCADNEGCCADEQGLYCCAASGPVHGR